MNLKVRFRSADTEANLQYATWSAYLEERAYEIPSSVSDNRWIEVEVYFETTDNRYTAVLNDITVNACCGATSTSYTYEYDALDRVTKITTDSDYTTFGYDAAGRLTLKTLPNGTEAWYTYDNVRRGGLTDLVNKKSDATSISSYSYAYDGVGNRTSMTTSAGTH